MQGTYCIYLPISTPSLDCKDSLSGSCSASWSKTTHVQHIEGLDDFQGHCPCFNGYLTHVSGVCPIGNYEHIPSWNIMDLSILWEFKRTMDDLPWLPTKKMVEHGWTMTYKMTLDGFRRSLMQKSWALHVLFDGVWVSLQFCDELASLNKPGSFVNEPAKLQMTFLAIIR